jgi:hypothetical protein
MLKNTKYFNFVKEQKSDIYTMLAVRRLNMDNTWMIEVDGVRLLIDPWLIGDEVDYFSWFNTQSHKTPPLPIAEIGLFDWTIITQHYPDHFHKDTLEMIHPSNVFCPPSTKSYFTKNFTSSTIESSNELKMMINQKSFCFKRFQSKIKLSAAFDIVYIESENHTIVLAPHGCDSTVIEQIQGLGNIDLLVTTFSLYLLPSMLGGTINPGLAGLKQTMESLNPKTVLMTHDEDKKASGLVPMLAKITKYPDEELLQIDFLRDKYKAINDYSVYTIN